MEEWKFWKETNRGRYGNRIYEVSSEGNAKINGVLVDFTKRKTKDYYTLGNEPLHRIVAKLFVPNPDPDNYDQVDHINTIKTDNRAENLCWCTVKMNNNNPLTRKHFSESAKNRPPTNKEHRRKLSELQIKASKRADVKKRRSEARKKAKLMTDGINTFYIKPEYWGEFIDIGFWFKTQKYNNFE